MHGEIRQLVGDRRMKIALAVLAASTLLTATAVPVQRDSAPQPGSSQVAMPVLSETEVQPVATSVASLSAAQGPIASSANDPALGARPEESSSSRGTASSQGSAEPEESAQLEAQREESSQSQDSASQESAEARHAAQRREPHHRPRLSAESLCLAPGSSAACQATFSAALRNTLAPADVVVSASGSAEIVGPRGAQPLRFQKHAPWVRRLETIGKEGIPFVRIPHGTDQEVVVGISRKGVLGVSLRERRD
jgi:hypothetical protein